MRQTKLSNGIEIYHFQTGTVAVHPPHQEYQGIPVLRFPSILISKKCTMDLPVSVWLLKSGKGNFLVDTGENVNINQEDYFGDDKVNGFINRRILKISVKENDQIDHQLSEAGLEAADIDAVILTHLHLDHTDGLKFFENNEIIVSKREWQHPFGAAFSTFPKKLSPKLIDYKSSDDPFGERIDLTDQVSIVPTPGHTFGHQSVLVQGQEVDFLIAGDVSFSQAQLKLDTLVSPK